MNRSVSALFHTRRMWKTCISKSASLSLYKRRSEFNCDCLTEIKPHHNGVFPAFGGAVIIRPLADYDETILLIQLNSSRIAGANLE